MDELPARYADNGATPRHAEFLSESGKKLAGSLFNSFFQLVADQVGNSLLW